MSSTPGELAGADPAVHHGGVLAGAASRRGSSVHLRAVPRSAGRMGRRRRSRRSWEKIAKVRRVVTGALEIERREKRIGSSLEAAPKVFIADAELLAALEGVDFAEVCITSAIEVIGRRRPGRCLPARRGAGRRRGAGAGRGHAAAPARGRSCPKSAPTPTIPTCRRATPRPCASARRRGWLERDDPATPPPTLPSRGRAAGMPRPFSIPLPLRAGRWGSVTARAWPRSSSSSSPSAPTGCTNSSSSSMLRLAGRRICAGHRRSSTTCWSGTPAFPTACSAACRSWVLGVAACWSPSSRSSSGGGAPIAAGPRRPGALHRRRRCPTRSTAGSMARVADFFHFHFGAVFVLHLQPRRCRDHARRHPADPRFPRAGAPRATPEAC